MSSVAATARSTGASLILLVIAGCVIAAVTNGIRTSFGLFTLPMTTDLGLTQESWGMALAIQNLAWGVALPVAGALADRYGTGRVIVVGLVIYVGRSRSGLGHVHGAGGRSWAGRRRDGRRGGRLLVVAAVMADRVPELTQAAAQAAAHLREPLGSEHGQRDQEDDDDLDRGEVEHLTSWVADTAGPGRPLSPGG